MEWNIKVLEELIYKPMSGEWGTELKGQEDENIIKVIRTANFTNEGIINYENIVCRNISSSKVEQKKLIFGDILVEKSGGTDKYPVGRVVLYDKIDEVFLSNNFTTVFRSKENIIYNKYLFYYLMFNYNRGGMTKYYNKTTGIQNLRVKNLIKELKVPVPPMNIQKQIVEVLDQAQSLIDKRKEQIKLLDDLIKSVFYDMFGDPITNSKNIHQVPLGELCKLKAGKFIKAAQISDYNKGNMYPCYGGNGLRGYVEEYTHNGSYPLIGRQGALCGNVQFAEDKFYATEHAIVTRPTLEIDVIWLYIMLREMNLNRLATGAAQPGLNVGNLVELQVMHPPLSLQVEFAKKFKEIENQKRAIEDSLKLLEDNYNSLMQRAFKGQLF